MDSLEATALPQKIISVYEVDVHAHKETKRGETKCSIKVITQLKFNITCETISCKMTKTVC